MALAIRSLIVRHMKGIDRFTEWNGTAEKPSDVPFPEGEEVIGWYQNRSAGEPIVLFTSTAIHLVEGKSSSRIPFKEVIDYDMPESKRTAEGVTVRMRHGVQFIRMAGSHGPGNEFRDAFALVSILQAVVRSYRQH